MVSDDKTPAQGKNFSADLGCLAIMIVRGGNNLREIYIKQVHAGYLGDVVEDLLSSYLNVHGGDLPKIKFGFEHDGLFYREVGVNHVFGSILPNGSPSSSGTDTGHYLAAICSFHRKLNAIEEAFRAEVDLSTEELLLEREQASYYKEHPRNCLVELMKERTSS